MQGAPLSCARNDSPGGIRYLEKVLAIMSRTFSLSGYHVVPLEEILMMLMIAKVREVLKNKLNTFINKMAVHCNGFIIFLLTYVL